MGTIVNPSLVVPTVLTLAACSGKTTHANATVADTANMAAASPAGTAASAENAMHYPDWAKAAAPPYPNATIGFPVNTRLYQFQSTDDTTTVGDWYTSHVNTSWHHDATYDSRSTVVNGVQIAISKISGPAGDAASAKTMITLSLR
jgi:hypothetical protein